MKNLHKILSGHFGDAYTLLLATSGAMAIRLMSENQFQIKLILLDISLPDMSGKELYNQLRNSLFFMMPPTVVITAYDQPAEVIDTVVGRSLEGYVTKPYAKSSLLKTIDRVLDSKKVLKTTFSKEFLIQRLIEQRNQHWLSWQQDNQSLCSLTNILDYMIRVDQPDSHPDYLTLLLKCFENDSGQSPNEPWTANIVVVSSAKKVCRELVSFFQDYDCHAAVFGSLNELLADERLCHAADVLVLDLTVASSCQEGLLNFIENYKREKNELIILSDYHGEEAVRHLAQAGIDKFITRPFRVSQLIEEIKHSFKLLYCLREIEEMLEAIRELERPLFIKKDRKSVV